LLHVLSLGYSCQVVSTGASDWLERLVSEVTCNVLMGMLNPAYRKVSTTSCMILTRYLWQERHCS